MKDLKENTIEEFKRAIELEINNYPLHKILFFTFCEKATQIEFLKAQRPFYYAVKAFPRLLSKLAVLIDNSEARVRVVENLWQEHGGGDFNLFHTTTYLQYLKALGNTDTEFPSHPAVDYWIEKMLSRNSSAIEYAVRLAAIEYIYTKVSQKILTTISHYELYCPQNHYSLHALLDIEHAHELIEVVQMLSKSIEAQSQIDYSSLKKIFMSSVNEFILMLNQLSFLTSKHIEEISRETVSFFYSREDTGPELEILTKINKAQPRILIIGSGGEHIFRIHEHYPGAQFEVLDSNIEQLNLIQHKINSTLNGVFHPGEDRGKFEQLFYHLREKILVNKNINNIEQLVENNSFLADLAANHLGARLVFSRYCEEIFSNLVLERVFTAEATRYSCALFSQHFERCLLTQIQELPSYKKVQHNNIFSILGLSTACAYTLRSAPECVYTPERVDKYYRLYPTKEFDLISLSNIGDWMSLEMYEQVLHSSFCALKDNGAIICRKLLGDYDLEKLLKQFNTVTFTLNDKTRFYTQTYCVFK